MTDDRGKEIGARVRVNRRDVQEGTITAIHGPYVWNGQTMIGTTVGAGGDLIVTVRLDDGDTVRAYVRQLEVIR